MKSAAQALAIALAILPLAACNKRSQGARPRVTELEVVDRSTARVLDGKALAERAAQALVEGGLFEVALGEAKAEGSHPWRCRVDVAGAVDQAGKGEGMLRAMAEVRCGPRTGDASETLTAEAIGDRRYSAADGDSAAALRAHVQALVRDTVGLVVRQRRLRTAPSADLVAALKDPDADVRRMALRAAATRRERQAVPALVALLSDSQEDVRDLALGALVEIGDPQAVKPITAQIKFGDVDELRKRIDAIATIGGDEARAFLAFVASGHEDAEIRKMAQRALDRLERRAGGKP